MDTKITINGVQNNLSQTELQIIVESLSITHKIVVDAKLTTHFNRNDRNVQLERVGKLKRKFEALL